MTHEKMKKIILMISMFFIPASAIMAATLKENSRACITEEFFDQQIKAKMAKDVPAMEYLFKNGYCILVNKDYQASILDTTFSGKVKVRVYVGKSAAELWTYSESIKN